MYIYHKNENSTPPVPGHMVDWLVALIINVALAIFQRYHDFDAGNGGNAD